MIKTRIDLTPYKMTAIGGEVASGKSFIMGLFIDELTAIGKTVFYVNIDGGPIRFDVDNPNVRCFVYFTPKDILDFYRQVNFAGEEVFMFLDSIGNIDFNYNNNQINPNISRAKQMREFILKLREFENIKTVFNFNYNRSITPQQKQYKLNHTFCCDKIIDVQRHVVETGTYKYDMYLDDNFLCSMDDLVLDPKIRSRERKISTLID